MQVLRAVRRKLRPILGCGRGQRRWPRAEGFATRLIRVRENLGLGFLSKVGVISASFCVGGRGGEGRGGAAKCSELHERAMRCIRRKLRLRLCERAVCVVGEGNGLLPPIRQGAKRSGRSALSESCSCRFRMVISCFRPRASVVSYTLHSERTSARYMGRAWPASMPLSR